MNELVNYLNERFDSDLSVSPLNETLKKKMPLYITSNYNIILGTYRGVEICLLESITSNSFTPDQLYKQSNLIKEKTGLVPVFSFKEVSSYNIDRYRKKDLNFIIPDKILFLPDLLYEYNKRTKTKGGKNSDSITPIAQLILLYHIQIQSLNGKTTKEITDIIKHPYISINRAVNNLNNLGLCDMSFTKERIIYFEENRQELWNQSLKMLQSPIEKIYHTDREFDGFCHLSKQENRI